MKNIVKFYILNILALSGLLLFTVVFGIAGLLLENPVLKILYGLLFSLMPVAVWFLRGKFDGTAAVAAKFKLKKSNPNITELEFRVKAFSIKNAIITPLIYSAPAVIIFLPALLFNVVFLRGVISIINIGYTLIFDGISFSLLEGWRFLLYIIMFLFSIAAYFAGYYFFGLKEKRVYNEANAEIKEFGSY